ncbi:MAG TPA: hypothetical protein VG010_02530, partial [Solirubrobacteraceae bacterium]|nr:hypothetical protein [Solirubrobacteraceae bacterium]
MSAIAPSVSGVARDGSTLNSSTGRWAGLKPVALASQWMRCNGSGEGCAKIGSATKSAYKATPEDIGRTLRVVVTATNADGSATAASGATGMVVALRPVKGTRPKVSGTAQDGQLLTAAPGTWRGTPPITFSYRWESCVRGGCSTILGATAQTYRAGTEQIARKIRAVVTATNTAGSATAATPATQKVVAGPPVNVGAPMVSGTPIVGQVLTASTGSWAGTPPFTYAYRWQSCPILSGECGDIAGASGSTYTVGPLDVGNALRVIVTASNKLGSAPATSASSSLVGAVLPSNSVPPSISGVLKDGQLLSAVAGTWSGTPPISYGYQWQVCNATGGECKDIAEAVESTLKLSPTLVGSTVRVVVTATNGAGSVPLASAATSVVGALLPSNSVAPSVSGVLKDGQLLSAVAGTWSGTPPISYGYQWQVCNATGGECKDIAEATDSALKLSPTLVGSTVRVIVTATNGGGSVPLASAATSLVGALLPSNSVPPSISGVLKDGQLLSAVTGTWSGTPPISYGYQWQACNATGGECKDIAEAVESTLKLSPGFVGSTLRVVVTATNGGGSVPLASAATSVVGALLPSNSVPPSISGVLKDGQLLSAVTGTWSGTPPISYGYQWQ